MSKKGDEETTLSQGTPSETGDETRGDETSGAKGEKPKHPEGEKEKESELVGKEVPRQHWDPTTERLIPEALAGASLYPEGTNPTGRTIDPESADEYRARQGYIPLSSRGMKPEDMAEYRARHGFIPLKNPGPMGMGYRPMRRPAIVPPTLDPSRKGNQTEGNIAQAQVMNKLLEALTNADLGDNPTVRELQHTAREAKHVMTQVQQVYAANRDELQLRDNPVMTIHNST